MHLIFVLLISMVRAESTTPPTTPPAASATGGNGPITNNSNEPAKTVSGDATKPQPLHYVTEFNNEFYKADDCATKNKYDVCLKILKMVKKFKDVKYADAVAVYKKACELKVESCEGLFEFAQGYAPENLDGLQKFFEDQCTKNILNCNELSQFYEYKKDYTNAINYARKYYVKFQKGNLIKYTYKYGDKTEALTAAFNECKAKKYNSCILVIGAPDTESSKQYDAFVEFCKNADTMPEALSKVQLPACIKPLAKDVPKQLRAYAELELKKLEN